MIRIAVLSDEPEAEVVTRWHGQERRPAIPARRGCAPHLADGSWPELRPAGKRQPDP